MRGWTVVIAMEAESHGGSQEGLQVPKGKSAFCQCVQEIVYRPATSQVSGWPSPTMQDKIATHSLFLSPYSVLIFSKKWWLGYLIIYLIDLFLLFVFVILILTSSVKEEIFSLLFTVIYLALRTSIWYKINIVFTWILIELIGDHAQSFHELE